MNETQKWPVLHILVGVPIVLAIAAILGAALDGWNMGKTALLYGATMTTPVGMVYTFSTLVIERSFLMVFWALEKTRERMNQARAEGEALGEAKGKSQGETQRDQEWRAWYERLQAAQREGQPFNEPPPAPPENRNGS